MKDHEFIIALKNKELDTLKICIKLNVFKKEKIKKYHFEQAIKYSNSECFNYLCSLNTEYVRLYYKDILYSILKENKYDMFNIYLSYLPEDINLSFNNNFLLNSAFFENSYEIFFLLFKNRNVKISYNREILECQELMDNTPFGKKEFNKKIDRLHSFHNLFNSLKFKIF
jgi:hypothetical protein